MRSKILSITFWFTGFVALIAYLLFSNSGLRCSLHLLRKHIDLDIEYSLVRGSWLGADGMQFKDLRLVYDGEVITAEQFGINLRRNEVKAHNLHGFGKFLGYDEHILVDEQAKLDDVDMTYKLSDAGISVRILGSGTWHQRPLSGSVAMLRSGGYWKLESADLNFGNNKFILQATDKRYDINLELIEPYMLVYGSGAISAQGYVFNGDDVLHIDGDIHAKNFKMLDLQASDLSTHVTGGLGLFNTLNFAIKAKELTIDAVQLRNVHAEIKVDHNKVNGGLQAIYQERKLSLELVGILQQQICNIDLFKVKLHTDELSGNGNINFKDWSSNLKLHGVVFNIPTKVVLSANGVQEANVVLDFKINQDNNAHADLNYDHAKIDGKIDVYARDLSFIMRWLPDVTRFKGELHSNISVSGSIAKPLFISKTSVKNITATLPRLGVKIKPMTIMVESDQQGRFTINGNGKMRRGPGEFTFHGYVEPFKDDIPNKMHLHGVNVEFVNNHLAHLVASADLDFVYRTEANQLDLSGDITVQQGHVTYNKNPNTVVKSKDVRFKSELDAEHNQAMRINPTIFLRIEDGIKFSGFNLSGDISGKLDIHSKNDVLYADGRVTIKTGEFSLPGQQLHIEHGRLLYPPGSLLTNPILDIKLYSQQEDVGNTSDTDRIVVLAQGPAQNPTISAQGLAEDQDKALSQALLTSSGVVSKHLSILKHLQLSEVGIDSREDLNMEFFATQNKYNPDFKHKDLVIGRKFGKRTHIQYLHGLGDTNKKARLKYKINKNWYVGVESGTAGSGVDLGFAFERD